MNQPRLVKWKDLMYALPAFAAGVGLWRFATDNFYETLLLCAWVGSELGLPNALIGVAFYVAAMAGMLQWGLIAGGGCLLILVTLRTVARHRRDGRTADVPPHPS